LLLLLMAIVGERLFEIDCLPIPKKPTATICWNNVAFWIHRLDNARNPLL
jgi:hypothetical protein